MKPTNFSWLDDFICGSAVPLANSDDFLRSQGISHIVSLVHASTSIDQSTLTVYSEPSEEVIQQFLRILKHQEDRDGHVLIHCQFGQERTGIMLVIYLVEYRGMDVREAIQMVRNKRPRSLRTSSSMYFLKNRYSL